MYRTMPFGRIDQPPKIKSMSNLIDGLRGFHLNLGWRGIDGVRDVGLESNQDSASVRYPFPETVVEVGVLIDQAVVPGRPVKVDKCGTESW
jgi:hypothetical protein